MLAANLTVPIPRLLSYCVVLMALAGCGTSTIVIKGNYPTPLAQRLPLTLGVYYAPELRNYSYQEVDEEAGDVQYLVQSGTAQLQLFNTVLPALFDKVIVLDSPAQAVGNGAIDAVFIPAIAEFQLGLPQKTKLKVYEIWARYNMKLTQPNGDPLADWVMTAYGKAAQEDLQAVDAGVQNAAMVAMRDLAASFTLGFAEVPAVKQWLTAGPRD